MSSARAVRCRLKCHNERNPCCQLLTGHAEDSDGTAIVRCEEGGDDVKSARPLRPGLHTCYNGEYRRQPPGNGAPIPKTPLSSDWSAEDSDGTAIVRCEEGGDDVKSARPLRPGLHTCYNGEYRRQPPGNGAPIPKTPLSSDWSLQPDSTKLDSLVIAHQPRRGEYVPGPCTHRPSSHGLVHTARQAMKAGGA